MPPEDDLVESCEPDEIRRRVVQPVVRSLIRPEELERIDVGWGPREAFTRWEDRDDASEMWVLIEAAGARWHSQIWFPGDLHRETLADVAADLASRLEDWVCERVAWGEQRIARYVIPPSRL